ncbi:MAG: HlyD family type I secretion periplasmic adaptor subunit [Rhizobiaceae bacterium]|nr:HlyD family type I secretion periplasmic adaptor subunit [Rhizobiaceae bacterium]
MSTADDYFAYDTTRWRADRHIVMGLIAIALTFGGVGWWSVASELHSAVIAPAEIRVESSIKPIQHTTGGLVGEILVRDGDHVKAGQVLLRFDRTSSAASYAIVSSQLDELLVRRARLQAEVNNVTEVEFPPELVEKAKTNPDLAKNIKDQLGLFQARLTNFGQQVSQLKERIGQLDSQIEGTEARKRSFETQIAAVAEELRIQGDLLTQKLTTRTLSQEFVREKARLEGELGALDADAARLRGQIQENGIEITRLQETRLESSIDELRDVESKIAELQQRLIVAEEDLSRTELTSPQDGVVQDMAVFAVGAVVAPGEKIMNIVPTADRLILKGRIDPSKRDQVMIGQPALVKFSAFNRRTTPELNGEVVKISADRKLDQQSGRAFYEVEVFIPDEERNRLDKEDLLVPGLPAEVYIQTGSRTPLSYFLKPLTDSFARAFRER